MTSNDVRNDLSSGREFLAGIVRGERPQAPISDTLGFWLVDAGDGTAAFEAEPGEHLLNPMGSVHGGFLATLLDSALGSAVLTRLPDGFGYTTVQLNVNLIRPVFPTTGRLRCDGTAVHVGRTTATAQARVVGIADGKLYAHGTATCAVVPLSS